MAIGLLFLVMAVTYLSCSSHSRGIIPLNCQSIANESVAIRSQTAVTRLKRFITRTIPSVFTVVALTTLPCLPNRIHYSPTVWTVLPQSASINDNLSLVCFGCTCVFGTVLKNPFLHWINKHLSNNE